VVRSQLSVNSHLQLLSPNSQLRSCALPRDPEAQQRQRQQQRCCTGFRYAGWDLRSAHDEVVNRAGPGGAYRGATDRSVGHGHQADENAWLIVQRQEGAEVFGETGKCRAQGESGAKLREGRSIRAIEEPEISRPGRTAPLVPGDLETVKAGRGELELPVIILGPIVRAQRIGRPISGWRRPVGGRAGMNSRGLATSGIRIKVRQGRGIAEVGRRTGFECPLTDDGCVGGNVDD